MKCLFCKEKFIGKHGSQIFCSERCSILHYKKYHKEELRKYMKEYNKKYQKSHKKELDDYQIKYRQQHKNESKEYRNSHKEERKRYYQKNKKFLLEINKQNMKNRLKADIDFRLSHYLRTRLNSALKGNPKLSTTMNLVGCSLEKLKQYLEFQFKSGMSWSNYGKWHIDHIKPCCMFDLSKKSEQKKCFNYKNLRPLWARENLERPRGKNK